MSRCLSREGLRTGALTKGQCLPRHRAYASLAPNVFDYETKQHESGLKYASRDRPGSTSSLSVVARAGTRYQLVPGATEGLEKFAFKSTSRRSALRIVRESELLGAKLSAYHSRESLVLNAKFLRGDLPYYLELLQEVIRQTVFKPYELDEEVAVEVQFAQQTFLKDTKEMAVNSAHGVAFHRGLGVPLKPSSSIALTEYLSLDAISSYAERAYSVNNCALVANGVEHEEMVKWVDRLFTEDEEVRSEHPAKLESPATEYFGGEERISHGSGNTMVIAFPGSPAPTGASYKPEVAVLTSLLGGQSGIKWSPGFSILSNALAKYQGLQIETKSAVYSDAGLLYIVLHGAASAVKSAASEVVQQFKKISKGEINKEDFQKAVARAKFKELESGETIQGALELTGAGLLASGKPYQFSHSADLISRVTEDQVVKAASTMLKGKASVSAVGNLFVLPYAGEIGLNV